MLGHQGPSPPAPPRLALPLGRGTEWWAPPGWPFLLLISTLPALAQRSGWVAASPAADSSQPGWAQHPFPRGILASFSGGS